MDETPLKTEFGWALVRAAEFESAGEFRRAYDLLEEFLQQHAAQDEEGWLFNAVRFEQASVLRMAGDLPGALGKHREVQPRREDRPFYLLNAYCIARILDELGRAFEALAEVRSSLENVAGPPIATDLGFLRLYADLAERLGEELPGALLTDIRAVVELWGVPLSEEETHDYRKVKVALRRADAAAHSRAPHP